MSAKGLSGKTSFIDFIMTLTLLKRYYFTKVFTKIKTGDFPIGRI